MVLRELHQLPINDVLRQRQATIIKTHGPIQFGPSLNRLQLKTLLLKRSKSVRLRLLHASRTFRKARSLRNN